MRPDLRGLGLHHIHGHIRIMAVFGRHMFFEGDVALIIRTGTPMRDDTLAALKGLDRAFCQSHPEFGPNQYVRDRIIVVVDPDMIIGAHGDLLPLCMDMARLRKLEQHGLIQLCEQLLARCP